MNGAANSASETKQERRCALPDKDAAPADHAIREWMERVLDEKGWSAAELARRAGVAGTTIQRVLAGNYSHMTSRRTLQKLVAAAGSFPPSPLLASAIPTSASNLLLRYRLMTGVWAEDEAMLATQTDLEQPTPVVPKADFAQFDQWLERIDDDSVNLRLPQGSFAHVVDVTGMADFIPREGDWLVVMRRKMGLVERSMRQVVAADTGGLELRCRSTNDRWRADAVPMGAGPDAPQVIGRVVGGYTPFV